MNEFSSMLHEETGPITLALEDSLAMLPESVREIAGYGMMSGGKRLRPFLVVLCSRLLGGGGSSVYRLASSLEMIHVATLLHDDILDEAETRRGKRAAHRQFGLVPSLLAGDALMAAANMITAGYHNPALVEALSDAMMRTVAGEAQELALQGSLDHNVETYLEMIIGKTGWLLRSACRMGAIHGGGGPQEIEALSEYGLNLGIAFQMVDDALDFADEAATGKPMGGDLREGKLTPPITRYVALLEGEYRERFAEKFANGGFTDDEVAAVSNSIRNLGFDGYARELADLYLKKAAHALESLPDTPERQALAQALEYVRDRRK